MTKEELKELGLSDEQITKVIEDYGKNYVSKSQFNQKNEELKTAKEELTNVNKEVDDLKKANKGNADLVAQIDKMKADAKTRQEEYDVKVKQLQINGIVDRAILTSKAKNAKAVKALLNLEGAEIDGDTIKGLDDQLKALQKSDAFLFDVTKTSVKPGEGGDNTPKTVTKEQFAKMNYSQRIELFNTNQELYHELNGGND